MSLFDAVPQFIKMLRNLDRWLVTATEYAKKKSFDAEVLLQARLAPDQYPLVRQVQIACDTVKLAASRLTGKDAPSHPDTEATLAELHTRVRSVLAYLEQFTPRDFADAAQRVITQPRWEGKVMSGADYFREHALPNFYFHTTHTYALLRHRGVPLGKRDYLGPLAPLRASGSFELARLQAKTCGACAPVFTSLGSYGSWTLVETPSIAVTGGYLELGFHTQATTGNGASFIHMDDVELVRL